MSGIHLIKKNPCPDCSYCQQCCKTRCSICRSVECTRTKEKKKDKTHKPLFRQF